MMDIRRLQLDRPLGTVAQFRRFLIANCAVTTFSRLLMLGVAWLLAASNVRADSIVIGQIVPSGLNYASGICFDGNVNPLVVDGFGVAIWRLNIANGSVVTSHPLTSSLATTRGLEYDPATEGYFTTRVITSMDSLARVDPASGVVTEVGGIGAFFDFVDLALDPVTGAMWLITDNSGGQLWSVNKATGAGALVQSYGGSMGQLTSIAIGPSGQLLVSSFDGFFYEINPATTTVTPITTTGLSGSDFVGDFEFDPISSRWYGIEERRSAVPRAWYLREIVNIPFGGPQDIDGDGVSDESDVCCHSPAGTVVDVNGRSLGDIDLDCDVDLGDYQLLESNFTGALAEDGPCCLQDADCDDGLFCTGTETCDTSTQFCVDGVFPCDSAAGEVCIEKPGVCVLDSCGNGLLDLDEECDDGNNVSGDGCSADCRIEPPLLLYASDPQSNSLGRVDPETGEFSVIGTFLGSFGNVTEIEWSPDGNTLYATTGGGSSTLLTVDPATGTILTSVFQTIGGALNGCEFDAIGTLLCTLVPAGGGTAPSDLVRVDPVTGIVTPIGPTGFANIGGLAFDSTFTTLFGITSGQPSVPPTLLDVDPVTGQATTIANVSVAVEMSSLEFTDDGRLIAAGDDGVLYEIDQVSGVAVPIGPLVNATKLSGLSVGPFVEPTCPGAGDCCDPAGNGTPGCNEEVCCSLVCAANPSCCGLGQGHWDAVCADLALASCTSCGGVVPTDDCDLKPVVGEGTFLFSNIGADTDGPLATCGSLGSDVWVNYVSTCDGTATIQTCGSLLDTAVEVFQGCVCSPTGAVVACNDDDNGECGFTLQSSVSFPVTAGECFKVRIGGFAGSQGTGTLTISCGGGGGVCGPGNGDCCVANLTPGCDDATCCNQICTVDPFCCDVEWDQFCADAAVAQCPGCIPACSPAVTCTVINGGFEEGNFCNWTATSNGLGEFFPWTVGPAGTGTGFHSSSPLSGNFDAINGFDGDAGLVYELFQDVDLPAGATVTLTTSHRIQFDSLGIPSALPRELDISIRDTGNVVLSALFHQDVLINGAPNTDLGWNTQVFDISAFAGQTVRIHFEEFIPEAFTGPGLIEFDDISLLCASFVTDGREHVWNTLRIPLDRPAPVRAVDFDQLRKRYLENRASR